MLTLLFKLSFRSNPQILNLIYYDRLFSLPSFPLFFSVARIGGACSPSAAFPVSAPLPASPAGLFLGPPFSSPLSRPASFWSGPPFLSCFNKLS